MTWWLTSGESEWWAYLREVSDRGAVPGPANDRAYRLVTAHGLGERPFLLILSPRHADSFDTLSGDGRMEVQVWRLDEDESPPDRDYSGLPSSPEGWATLCGQRSSAARLGAWANAR